MRTVGVAVALASAALALLCERAQVQALGGGGLLFPTGAGFASTGGFLAVRSQPRTRSEMLIQQRAAVEAAEAEAATSDAEEEAKAAARAQALKQAQALDRKLTEKLASVDASAVSRASIIKSIKRAEDAASFKEAVLSAEVEKFLRYNAGSSMYGKLMKKVAKRGKELNVEIPSEFALKPVAQPEPEPEAEAEEAAPAGEEE
jgi:hypothetical protein